MRQWKGLRAMNYKALMVCAATLIAPSISIAQLASVPVMLYPADERAETTVCVSSGNIHVNSFVLVRMGPGTNFKEIDRVHDGLHIAICDDHDGWYGIVYDEWNGVFTEGDYCHLDIKYNKRKKHPYYGPCRHGWISKKFVTDLAG
jgi:hypothetical protein